MITIANRVTTETTTITAMIVVLREALDLAGTVVAEVCIEEERTRDDGTDWEEDEEREGRAEGDAVSVEGGGSISKYLLAISSRIPVLSSIISSKVILGETGTVSGALSVWEDK